MTLKRKKRTQMKQELQSSTSEIMENLWDIDPYAFVSNPQELDRQEIEAVKQGFDDAKAGRTLTRAEMNEKLKSILKHWK